MNPGRWRAAGAAVVGLILILIVARACGSSSADPTSYIQETYERESSLDEGRIDAYVADNKSPAETASEISAAAEPLDRRTSSEKAAEDGGDAVFLQYSDEIVSIFPYQDGSKVMLGNYRQAHSHYFVYVGGWWGSSPGYGGGGSGTRGGGVGTGK